MSKQGQDQQRSTRANTKSPLLSRKGTSGGSNSTKVFNVPKLSAGTRTRSRSPNTGDVPPAADSAVRFRKPTTSSSNTNSTGVSSRRVLPSKQISQQSSSNTPLSRRSGGPSTPISAARAPYATRTSRSNSVTSSEPNTDSSVAKGQEGEAQQQQVPTQVIPMGDSDVFQLCSVKGPVGAVCPWPMDNLHVIVGDHDKISLHDALTGSAVAVLFNRPSSEKRTSAHGVVTASLCTAVCPVQARGVSNMLLWTGWSDGAVLLLKQADEEDGGMFFCVFENSPPEPTTQAELEEAGGISGTSPVTQLLRLDDTHLAAVYAACSACSMYHLLFDGTTVAIRHELVRLLPNPTAAVHKNSVNDDQKAAGFVELDPKKNCEKDEGDVFAMCGTVLPASKGLGEEPRLLVGMSNGSIALVAPPPSSSTRHYGDSEEEEEADEPHQPPSCRVNHLANAAGDKNSAVSSICWNDTRLWVGTSTGGIGLWRVSQSSKALAKVEDWRVHRSPVVRLLPHGPGEMWSVDELSVITKWHRDDDAPSGYRALQSALSHGANPQVGERRVARVTNVTEGTALCGRVLWVASRGLIRCWFMTDENMQTPQAGAGSTESTETKVEEEKNQPQDAAQEKVVKRLHGDLKEEQRRNCRLEEELQNTALEVERHHHELHGARGELEAERKQRLDLEREAAELKAKVQLLERLQAAAQVPSNETSSSPPSQEPASSTTVLSTPPRSSIRQQTAPSGGDANQAPPAYHLVSPNGRQDSDPRAGSTPKSVSFSSDHSPPQGGGGGGGYEAAITEELKCALQQVEVQHQILTERDREVSSLNQRLAGMESNHEEQLRVQQKAMKLLEMKAARAVKERDEAIEVAMEAAKRKADTDETVVDPDSLAVETASGNNKVNVPPLQIPVPKQDAATQVSPREEPVSGKQTPPPPPATGDTKTSGGKSPSKVRAKSPAGKASPSARPSPMGKRSSTAPSSDTAQHQKELQALRREVERVEAAKSKVEASLAEVEAKLAAAHQRAEEESHTLFQEAQQVKDASESMVDEMQLCVQELTDEVSRLKDDRDKAVEDVEALYKGKLDRVKDQLQATENGERSHRLGLEEKIEELEQELKASKEREIELNGVVSSVLQAQRERMATKSPRLPIRRVPSPDPTGTPEAQRASTPQPADGANNASFTSQGAHSPTTVFAVNETGGAAQDLWWKMHFERVRIEYKELQYRVGLQRLWAVLAAQNAEHRVKYDWIQDISERDEYINTMRQVVNAYRRRLAEQHTTLKSMGRLSAYRDRSPSPMSKLLSQKVGETPKPNMRDDREELLRVINVLQEQSDRWYHEATMKSSRSPSQGSNLRGEEDDGHLLDQLDDTSPPHLRSNSRSQSASAFPIPNQGSRGRSNSRRSMSPYELYPHRRGGGGGGGGVSSFHIERPQAPAHHKLSDGAWSEDQVDC